MEFGNRSDYEVALLRFMAKVPNHQGDAGEICEAFEREYHDHIPTGQYGVLESGEDEVDAAIYKRAKRVADVCRGKLIG